MTGEVVSHLTQLERRVARQIVPRGERHERRVILAFAGEPDAEQFIAEHATNLLLRLLPRRLALEQRFGREVKRQRKTILVLELQPENRAALVGRRERVAQQPLDELPRG